MKFPFPQICVHSVAGNLLSLLEENGVEPTPDFVALARAVVRAENEDALEILGKTYLPVAGTSAQDDLDVRR